VPTRKALFLSGGWEGHQPDRIVERFAEALRPHGFEPRIETSLACLTAIADLARYDLIFPCWTMGQLTKEQSAALVGAVRAGANLGGLHGGMGDAFRGDLDYEWMVGGHFAGHPHVGEYTVRVIDTTHPITAGLPREFLYRSEQYYMLIDPGVHVLAETDYAYEGRTVRIPVAWTKPWGRGRVFYCSLGHEPAEFDRFPAAMDLALRGLRWAAGAL
jgi:uncharacterized protein